ncbi:MAG: response regulator [Alicyclobacillus sp.]|nr:response regulator [Alicyclobacillus sp.]
MPSGESYTVVVTDDDFMIARLHARFIDDQPEYRVLCTTSTGAGTLNTLEHLRPDLLVLDIYLPDLSGIGVLAEIRNRKLPCDVILITAAREREVVEEGFRLGIFDYLVKPFKLERLGDSLRKYAEYRRRLATSESVDQSIVDHLTRIRAMGGSTRTAVESGFDPRTLDRIRRVLAEAGRPCTANEVAAMAGVSRSTARAYLDHLIELQVAEEDLSYGTVGRPKRLFQIRT